ncbi:MAG TPA: hypothetical protein VMS76_18800 [Planctomycetota bacterium]|nr:hypothetical protein [Planctomycetota bacterium]
MVTFARLACAAAWIAAAPSVQAQHAADVAPARSGGAVDAPAPTWVRPVRASLPESSAALLFDNGPWITQLGVGFGGADVSEIESGLNTFGLNCTQGTARLADDFVVPVNDSWTLTDMTWRSYMTNGGPSTNYSGATVQIWNGPPPSGTVVAGDLTTNRYMSHAFSNVYRIVAGAFGDTARAVIDVKVDMSWVPALSPGTYFVDIAVTGSGGASGPWTNVTVPWDPSDSGLQFFGGTWNVTTAGQGSGPVDFPYTLEGFSDACTGNVSIYCTAKVNSSGCTPAIHAVGFPVENSEGGFDLFATEVLNAKFGLLFYGKTGASSAPFQGGFLCAQTPITRTLPQSSGSGGTPPCGGVFKLDFNTYALSGADPALVSGQSVWAQYWSRDPASPSTTSLTNAVEFTICEDPPPFKNMVWSNTLVPLSNAGAFNHTATLNGLITVSSNAAPNGSVGVVFDDGSMATVQQMPSGSTLIMTAGSTLDLLTPGTGPGDDNALLNGNPISLQSILNTLELNVSQGVPPNSMAPAVRAMLAFGSLARTQPWTDNVAVAKLGFLGDAWVSWCKSSVVAALSSLSLRETTICNVDCASGGTVSLGGWRVPCAELCISGAFIGLPAARTVLEGLWNP